MVVVFKVRCGHGEREFVTDDGGKVVETAERGRGTGEGEGKTSELFPESSGRRKVFRARNRWKSVEGGTYGGISAASVFVSL